MSESNGSDYELLTEHFGYPPVSLIDDIINTVNVLADRALDSIERLLLSLPPEKLGFKPTKDGAQTAQEAARREIENGTHQLETLLNAAIDKNFDIFELYTMQNILTVAPEDRPFVRLSHYDGLDLSDSPDRPTVGGVMDLRRRLYATQKLRLALEAESARNDALLKKLKRVMGVPTDGGGGDGSEPVKTEQSADGTDKHHGGDDDGADKPLAFLRNKGDLVQGGADRPIATTTEFALSQLQSLRSLSASLNKVLPALMSEGHDGEGQDGVDDADSGADKTKSWRRQRAVYIEQASRSYLERSAGLELDAQGQVRDGEGQAGSSAGPSFTKDQVEGLEKVASMLASSTTSQQRRDDDAMDES